MSEASIPLVLTVYSRDGQYQLRGQPGEENPWSDPVYGLFVGGDNWVTILCGTEWGPVAVTVHVHRAAPDQVDRAWDMAAEWTLDCGDGQLDLRELYVADTPTRIMVPAGWVRLRVSVRGRHEAVSHSEPITEAIEQHLLEVWPVDDHLEPTELYGPDSMAPLLG